MADTKITALTALTGADPANDVIPIVDVSDTTMAASGTTKKISVNNILGASGTATLASATITGDLTVATDRLKVVTGSTAIQTGSTTQLQVGTTAWPSGYIGKSGSRSLFGNTGEVIVWNESAAAIGNYSSFYLSAKTGAGATTLGGSMLRGGIENASDYSGFISLWTQTSAGTMTKRYEIDSSGNSVWSVGGSTAMTLNSTGLGVGASPSQRLHVKLDQNAYTYSRIDNQNASSGAYAALMLSAYGNSWGIGVGSAAANSNALDFFLDAGGANSLKMRLDASGNLLVGTTTTNWGTDTGIYGFASGALNITRNGGECSTMNRLTSDGQILRFYRSNALVGAVSVTTTGTTYDTSSDYRLKESVQPLSGGLARVNALKPSVYKWKIDGSTGEGFIAHELAEVVPLAVNGQKDAVNEDGSIKAQGIDMSRVVPILVAAIQELAAEVNALKNA